MDKQQWLTDQFETERPHLRAVAYRMLGSPVEADDAVQEAWLRLNRSDASSIENLGGWLTTVVARVCLDMLRSRNSRREDPVDAKASDRVAYPDTGVDPEHEVVQADSVGLAMLVVLETLTPPERVAFVLHDMFAVPFDEIAPIVGRTPEASRQLASRARRRVQGEQSPPPADRARQQELVTAFIAASRGGDFDALVALLDPDIVLRADTAAVAMGSEEEVRGAAPVAQIFSGRAQGAQVALIDGRAGLVWAPGGRPRVIFAFATVGDNVIGIEMIADAARLERLDLELVDD